MKGEYLSKLHRRQARLQAQESTMAEVLRYLPAEAQVDYIDVKGPHEYGCDATLLIKAHDRAGVIPQVQILKPVGLSLFVLKRGGAAIWPTSKQLLVPGDVETRYSEPLVPFIYTVTKAHRQKTRHTVTWLTLVGQSLCVVLCDIAHDEAGFRLEHLDDVAHNQVLFRRVPNAYVPQGRRRGINHEWQSSQEFGATVTVFWGFDDVRAKGGPHARWAYRSFAYFCLEVDPGKHRRDVEEGLAEQHAEIFGKGGPGDEK